MKAIAKFIASGFYSGLLPKAPGTWGALVALGITFLLVALQTPSLTYVLIGLIVVFTLLGVWATDVMEPEWGKDPSRVVVDEMVGLWISVLCVPTDWYWLVLGFALFRLFDIWKPLGIRNLEALKGGIGVMADDILAGIYALASLHAVIYVYFQIA